MVTSRSPGLHLSDVIHDMDRELMRTERGELDDATRLQFEKGWLWEEALSQAFAKKGAKRIGEILEDGITMTPDGVSFDGDDFVVEEYKCTALSADKPPTDNWKWMMQAKGYCKALGAFKCIFRVLHHMDIMWHPGRAYGTFLLTFTQRELDENWEAVVNHAKVMRGRE